MTVITSVTRGGEEYTPAFVMDINQSDCIGCGRCYKVCPRDVFDLVERDDSILADGSMLAEDDYDDYDDDGYGDYDDDDDDGFSDDTAMVMALKDAMDCIGCGSCARICPKKCFTHEPQSAAA